MHHIRLVDGVKPVCSKVRNVPVAVREQVQSELERLKADGIIEEVEATQWHAPVVTAKKADGSLRLCGPEGVEQTCCGGSLSLAEDCRHVCYFEVSRYLAPLILNLHIIR